QFNYTPRYWDPRKEEMEQRRARIRKQLQEERERAAQKDDVDDMDFVPRSSAKTDDYESNTHHRTTLQHGFLREQRGRAGASDDNKLMKVVVISAAVLIVYLVLKHFGI
ncbi:MAG: hypothetical protein J6S93_09505, partial [Paludibacteraceae bacterium]|nr:hypothetical protein [Paludibacteraceae bacterium]